MVYGTLRMAAGNPDTPPWLEFGKESDSGHRQYSMGGNYFLWGWGFLPGGQGVVKGEVRVTKCREVEMDIDRRKCTYKVNDSIIRGVYAGIDRG